MGYNESRIPKGGIMEINLNYIAFIIDNEVVEIIRTDDRIAAIWLSQPTIVNVTGEDKNSIAEIGYTYNPETQTFTAPEF
jgi:hypothetical protein